MQAARQLRYFQTVQRILVSLLLLDLLAFWPLAERLRQPQDMAYSEAESLQTMQQAALPAAAGNLFGNICIEAEEKISLAQACLLINGMKSGDFREGYLTVRVRPGDILQIDASAYQRELIFFVVETSASIDSNYLRAEVISYGDVADVGIIVFH